MADIINMNAESDRNIIGDDSSPTLTLENSSTGKAIRAVNSGTGVAIQGEAAATSPVGDLYHTTPGSATVAVLRVTASTASAPFFEFKGFLASISSACSLQRGIRVKLPGDLYGWLPVYFGGETA